MSVSTYLVCHTCKQRLWIGQKDHIYTAPKYLVALNTFLQAHRYAWEREDHELGFSDELNHFIASYKEMST